MSRRLLTMRDIPKGDSRLLPGKLAGVFDVRRQQWRTVMFQPDPHQNEKVLARELVEDLPAGTLVVADLGYFGFAWFDWLTDRGYRWLSRLRAKTSYKVIHTYYHRGDVFDGIVWLGAHRADRAKHAVRLVTFRQGNTLRRYITNVRRPSYVPDSIHGRGLRSQVGHRDGACIGQAASQAASPVVFKAGGDSPTDMGDVDNLAGPSGTEA